MHALRDIDKKPAHPGAVPRQVPGGWIGKEPVQRNTGSAKIDDLAVQDGLVAVKVKFAHSAAALKSLLPNCAMATIASSAGELPCSLTIPSRCEVASTVRPTLRKAVAAPSRTDASSDGRSDSNDCTASANWLCSSWQIPSNFLHKRETVICGERIYTKRSEWLDTVKVVGLICN